MSDYDLARVKREWVPERIWRLFCIGNLATWEPFYTLLTRKPKESDHA